MDNPKQSLSWKHNDANKNKISLVLTFNKTLPTIKQIIITIYFKLILTSKIFFWEKTCYKAREEVNISMS